MNEALEGAATPMANAKPSLAKPEKQAARWYGLIGGDDPLGALNLERMIRSAVQVRFQSSCPFHLMRSGASSLTPL